MLCKYMSKLVKNIDAPERVYARCCTFITISSSRSVRAGERARVRARARTHTHETRDQLAFRLIYFMCVCIGGGGGMAAAIVRTGMHQRPGSRARSVNNLFAFTHRHARTHAHMHMHACMHMHMRTCAHTQWPVRITCDSGAQIGPRAFW